MDVPLRFHFEVVPQTVNFVDENFKLNIRVDLVSFGDCKIQFVQCFHVVILQEVSWSFDHFTANHILGHQ